MSDCVVFDDRVVAEFRTIARFEGYRFSLDGSIWSCRGRGGFGPDRVRLTDEWRKLGPSPDADGYLTVRIRLGGKSKTHAVHRLICEAFHGPCPDGMEACHYPDRDPGNCRADNLRWGTSAENKEDTERHGTRAKGSVNGRAKLTEGDIPEIRRLFAGPTRTKQIAEMYGVDPKLIRKIGNLEIWRHVPIDN